MNDSTIRALLRLVIATGVVVAIVLGVESIAGEVPSIQYLAELHKLTDKHNIEALKDVIDPRQSIRLRFDDWFRFVGLVLSIFFLVDQFGALRAIDEWLLPRQPDFLASVGRPKGRRYRRREFVGRGKDVAILNAFARQRAPGLLIDGLIGKRGVGKTRLAYEWCWHLSRWRLLAWQRWHVGRLKNVDNAWVPRRKTLILVSGDADRDLFWEALKAFGDRRLRRRVRILLDCDMDFDLMIEGHDGEEIELFRRHLSGRARRALDDFLGQHRENKKPVVSLSRADTLAKSRDARRDEEPSNLPTDPQKPIFSSIFWRVEPLDRKSAFTLVQRVSAGRARASIAETDLLLEAAQYRPKYLEILAAKMSRGQLDGSRARADAVLQQLDHDVLPLTEYVDREDARSLIGEAARRFPEEALPLVITAALGRGHEIKSELRRKVAPGANDRRGLARVFRDDVADTWRRNKSDLLPTLPDNRAPLARHVLRLALLRLQRADAAQLAQDLFSSSDAQAFRQNLDQAIDWPEWDWSLKLLLVEGTGAPVVAELESRLRGAVGDDMIAATDPQNQIQTLVHGALKGTGADQLRTYFKQLLIPLLERQPVDCRAEVLINYANVVGDSGKELGGDIRIIAQHVDWVRSEQLFELLMMLVGEGRLENWDKMLGEAPLPLDKIPALNDALRGFQIMDAAFSNVHENGEGLPLEVLQESDQELIARLIRSPDRVEQLAGVWSSYWVVSPTESRKWPTISPAIVEALFDCADNESASSIWARAVATLAKLALGSTGDKSAFDHVYDWAVLVDQINTQLRSWDGEQSEAFVLPNYRVPPPFVPALHLSSIDGRVERIRAEAKRILAKPSAGEPTVVRRAAALFLLALYPTNPLAEAVNELIDAVTDPNLSWYQRLNFLVRLAQANQWEAMVEVLKTDGDGNDDLSTPAYLGIVALGHIAKIPIEVFDREAFRDGRQMRSFLLDAAARADATIETVPSYTD